VNILAIKGLHSGKKALFQMSTEVIPNRKRKVHQREEVDSGDPTNGPEARALYLVPGFSEGNFCIPEEIFSLQVFN
jgi:hypothetical protein